MSNIIIPKEVAVISSRALYWLSEKSTNPIFKKYYEKLNSLILVQSSFKEINDTCTRLEQEEAQSNPSDGNDGEEHF